jgi:hypothetical protein
MGLPKITPFRAVLMILVVLLGPASLLSLSSKSLGAAEVLCLFYVALGGFAAPKELRRVFATVLSGIAIGTLIGAALLHFAQPVVMPGPWQFWHMLVVVAILALCYLIGFGTVRGAFRFLALFSIDFLQGLDTFVQKEPDEVRKFLVNQYLGLGQAYFIVEDGQFVTTKPAGVLNSLGGKGLILIKPANAVVTEWGGEIRRILGPGIDWTERFERPKLVLPLSPQRMEIDTAAQTCEGIPLHVRGFAHYQIAPPVKGTPHLDLTQLGPSARQNPTGVTRPPPSAKELTRQVAHKLNLPQPKDIPINTEAVLKAIYCSADGDWKRCALDAVGAAVVGTVSRKSLADLYKLEPNAARASILTVLALETQRRANEVTAGFGVIVTNVALTHLEAPREVGERVLKPIAAAGEAEAIGARAEAQMTATEQLESVRSEVRTEEIRKLVDLLIECQDKVPADQLIRAIGITERLTGAIARQTPEDGLRLIQSVEDSIGRLMDR